MNGEELAPEEWAAHFLQSRGIDPAIWAERSAALYYPGAEWVREEFRPHLRPSKLGTVTRAVKQAYGYLMPKWAPPGFPSIPPQLRPAWDVIMDQRIRWQYHGPVIDPELIVFPEDAGEGLAGKRLDQKVKRRCADGREHWIALGTILYG